MAAGAEAPFVAPDTLLPYTLDYCDDLWRAVTGDCSPCVTAGRLVGALVERLTGQGWACPE